MQRPALFGFLIVACVVVYLLWRPDFAPMSPNLAVSAAAPTPLPSASPSAAPVSAVATPLADEIPADTQTLIRQCLEKKRDLPTVHYSDHMRLADLVRDLSQDAAVAPQNLVVNVHVLKPDGTELRLHLEPHDRDSKTSPSRWPVAGSDLRVFTVDSEGLPVDAPYPKELKLESAKSIIEAFSSQGHVTFNERRYHESFGQGLAADVVETGHRVSELQLFFGGNSLGCAWAHDQLTCKCL